MGRPTTEQVRRRIKKHQEGSVFLVRDFLDLGRQETITRILSRLTSDGLLRRLQQGIYEYPRTSKLLGTVVPPDPKKVAEAMARRNGNAIVPTRAQAANKLGLTTQIQAKNVFLTNSGKPRKAQIGNQIIELRPVSARHFPKSNSESVIQALRFVGEENLTEEIVMKLQKELTARQKAALRRKIGEAPGWMQEALYKITNKEMQDR